MFCALALGVGRSTAGRALRITGTGWPAGRALRITAMGWPANAAQKKGPEGPLILGIANTVLAIVF